MDEQAVAGVLAADTSQTQDVESMSSSKRAKMTIERILLVTNLKTLMSPTSMRQYGLALKTTVCFLYI